MRSLYIVILFSNLLMAVACVGPTTPFGALNYEENQKLRKPSQVEETSPIYKIAFHPNRQVYHDKTDFSIEVQSEKAIPDDLLIQVFHNKQNVTESFLNLAKIHNSHDQKTRIFMISDFRLKALDPNLISVKLIQKDKLMSIEDYQSPSCLMTENKTYSPTGHFKPAQSYLKLIEKVALSEKSNPALLGAVVTQESGFNPQAVSWAKAIGLTQVTPLAEEQILKSVEDWPRYPGINTLSYLTLKSKIVMGEISSDKEWRLDPEKSLRGGLSYLQYLQTYWDLEQNKKLISQLKGDPDQVLTDLILASYNSGPARVRQAVATKGNEWKRHEKLKEALRYLRKVKSYCYHYAKKEVKDDSET